MGDLIDGKRPIISAGKIALVEAQLGAFNDRAGGNVGEIKAQQGLCLTNRSEVDSGDGQIGSGAKVGIRATGGNVGILDRRQRHCRCGRQRRQ